MLKKEGNPTTIQEAPSDASFSTSFAHDTRDVVQQLYDIHGDKTSVLIDIYRQFPNELSLEFIRELSDRYGSYSLQLLENWGTDTPEHELKCRDLLESIASKPGRYAEALFSFATPASLQAYASEPLATRFKDLTIEHTYSLTMSENAQPLAHQFGHELLQLYERYGSIGASLHQRALTEPMEEVLAFERKEQKNLRRLKGENREQEREGICGLLESRKVSLPDLQDRFSRLIDIAGRYGSAIVPWYEERGNDIIGIEKKARTDLLVIRDRFKDRWIDEYLGKTFASIPDDALLNNPDDIIAIAWNCDEYAIPVFGILKDNPDTLTYDGDIFVAIAESERVEAFGAARSFVYKVPDTIKDDTGFCRALVYEGADEVKTLFDTFPWDLHSQHREEIISQLKRYGSLMGPLVEQFGDKVLEKCKEHEALLDTIHERFGSAGPLFLRSLPEERWKEVDTLYEAHGKAAPTVLDYYGPVYDAIESSPALSEFRELRDRARDELGIRHIERFARLQVIPEDSTDPSDAVDYSLVQEALDNLNPEYNSEKPLLLAVYAEADHNGALNCFYEYESLKILSERYKVIIIEASNKGELDELIQGIGHIHGLDASGRSQKPIDVLFFSGHGSPSGITLGDASENDDEKSMEHRLTTDDKELIASWSPYVRHDGMAVFSACRLAAGGLDSDNFAHCWHDCYPEMALDAAGQSCTFDGILLDEEQQLQGLHFESIAEERVLRLRNGTQVYRATDIYGNDTFFDCE